MCVIAPHGHITKNRVIFCFDNPLQGKLIFLMLYSNTTRICSSCGHRGSTLFALLALVTVMCAAATAYFLYAETAHYQKPPTVWSK